MRILVISDIHANLVAFEAVLEATRDQWDMIWCLGDVVGYGPKPNECVALLKEQAHLSLSGNHDWAVLGRLDLDTFNDVASLAISWTQGVLTDESRDFLEALPSKTIENPFTLAHASPQHPVWEYIMDLPTAAENFDHFDTAYCLVGHSHVPIVFEQLTDDQIAAYGPRYERAITLSNKRLIINPGSVGQPRDYDPRAAYALLDTEKLTWEHCRVDYSFEKVQSQMKAIGMHRSLIDRLAFGW